MIHSRALQVPLLLQVIRALLVVRVLLLLSVFLTLKWLLENLLISLLPTLLSGMGNLMNLLTALL